MSSNKNGFHLSEAHREHLMRFRIPEEMLLAARIESVTDREARERLGIHGQETRDFAGIYFPYFDPMNGNRTGARVRLDSATEDGKYQSEQGCRYLFFPPMGGTEAKLVNRKIPVVIVEAEKSALAVEAWAKRMNEEIVCIAVGGVSGWKRKGGLELRADGSKEPFTEASPSFDLFAWEERDVVLLYDSNVAGRNDLEWARWGLAKALKERKARVLVATVPKLDGVNGPDDLLAVASDEALLKILNAYTEAAAPRFYDGSAANNGARMNAPVENGPQLLRDVENFYRRFVILPARKLFLLALFTIATYCYRDFDSFPYLVLTSPQKRSGKTRTTEIMALLAHSPLRSVGDSEAALFREIENRRPTLILDESEALNGQSERAEAIRAILCAGNRQGASVGRVLNPKGKEVTRFNVYCPKVLCAINFLPDTLLDRAIVINMERQQTKGKVERFRESKLRDEAMKLTTKLAFFFEGMQFEDFEKDIAAAMLQEKIENDRDVDNFEPLLCVLSRLDWDRKEEFLQDCAALSESKAQDDADSTLSARLVSDILEVLEGRTGEIATRELHGLLTAIEDSPWHDNKRFTKNKMTRMLKSYGVLPITFKDTLEKNTRGFSVNELRTTLSPYKK